MSSFGFQPPSKPERAHGDSSRHGMYEAPSRRFHRLYEAPDITACFLRAALEIPCLKCALVGDASRHQGPGHVAARRELRAARPLPEPHAGQGAAHHRLRHRLRARGGRLPLRHGREGLPRFPFRLRRLTTSGATIPWCSKAIRDVLDLNLPNMVQLDSALMSGLLAERLVQAAGAAGRAASRLRFPLQQRHRGGGGRAEVRQVRHAPAARCFRSRIPTTASATVRFRSPATRRSTRASGRSCPAAKRWRWVTSPSSSTS